MLTVCLINLRIKRKEKRKVGRRKEGGREKRGKGEKKRFDSLKRPTI